MIGWKRKTINKKIKKTRLYPEKVTYVKRYKSFNIFTKDGQNRVVKSSKAMTLDEAMAHFDCLSISGND